MQSLLKWMMAKWQIWLVSNWKVLIFWTFCALLGWWAGINSKKVYFRAYFRLTGVHPEEVIPQVLQASKRDPTVGSVISFDGLTDWHGKPVKLASQTKNKLVGLLFICGRCGVEEVLIMTYALLSKYKNKIDIYIIYIGQNNSNFYILQERLKDFKFLRDPNLTVLRRLNALYMPRFYLVAPDGKLVYLSKMSPLLRLPERWAEELEKINKVLEGLL